jgi:hypothetical protein
MTGDPAEDALKAPTTISKSRVNALHKRADARDGARNDQRIHLARAFTCSRSPQHQQRNVRPDSPARGGTHW